MITKLQVLQENYFHAEPRLVVETPCQKMKWRRNGKTKIWKTRPNDFEIPIKHGLYHFGYIRNFEKDQGRSNSTFFHVENECLK